MNIRPVSDLRNHCSPIKEVARDNDPAFLTNSNHSSDSIESALDEADRQAATTSLRYTHNEVFNSIRNCRRCPMGSVKPLESSKRLVEPDL